MKWIKGFFFVATAAFLVLSLEPVYANSMYYASGTSVSASASWPAPAGQPYSSYTTQPGVTAGGSGSGTSYEYYNYQAYPYSFGGSASAWANVGMGVNHVYTTASATQTQAAEKFPVAAGQQQHGTRTKQLGRHHNDHFRHPAGGHAGRTGNHIQA